MKFFLDTSQENPWGREQWARVSATWLGHQIVTDPDRADAVVMTLADPRAPYDQCIANFTRSDGWRRLKSRTYVYDTQDAPLGLFPGIYTSLRRTLFSHARHRTGPYLQSFNPYLAAHRTDVSPRWLFSFQGNYTSPVRGRLLSHRFDRSDVLVERTEPLWTKLGDASTQAVFQRYAEVIGESRFVLCPKGNGTSSYRLFETMQSARVPVILANPWVATAGIPWESFSVRVAERDIARLPEICEAHESRWREMGTQARSVWERHFSPQSLGTFLEDSIRTIDDQRRLPEACYAVGWPLRRGLLGGRRLLVRAHQLAGRLTTRGS